MGGEFAKSVISFSNVDILFWATAYIEVLSNKHV